MYICNENIRNFALKFRNLNKVFLKMFYFFLVLMRETFIQINYLILQWMLWSERNTTYYLLLKKNLSIILIKKKNYPLICFSQL